MSTKLCASLGGSGRPVGDTEVGTPEASLAHQSGDDPTRAVVDRDGEPEAYARDGSVDPDQAAFPSASAPPELPGLSAASVWITFSTIRTVDPDRVGSERPRAETTPAVTEPPKP